MADSSTRMNADSPCTTSHEHVATVVERPAATVPRQRIEEQNRRTTLSYRSELMVVESDSALGLPTGAMSDHDIRPDSLCSRQHDEVGTSRNIETQTTAASCFHGFSFATCDEDEDAEGELDYSFASGTSFWETNPGDTTANTVDTLDYDDNPVPLLGRDGNWRGTLPSEKTAIEHDAQSQRSRLELSLQLDHTTDQENICWPTALHSAPYHGTRRRRAESNTRAINVEKSASANRSRETFAEAEPRSDGPMSTSVQASKKAKLDGHKRTKQLRSSTKAKLGKDFSSEYQLENVHASSKVDNIASSKIVSSPASAKGRYRLKKKEKVPILSLAELLTPPPNKSDPQSDEAVHGSTEGKDDFSVDTVKSEGDNYQDLPVHAEENNTSTDGRKEPNSSRPEHDLMNDGQVKFDESEAKTGPEVAPKTEPEQHFLVAPRRERRPRTFPHHWEIHPKFPLLYQRYSVPSSVSPEVLEMLLRHLNIANVSREFREIVNRARKSHGIFNKPRSILDLYTPRFVKGVGAQKVGMCPVCYEDGKVNFFKTKFSAYNYHLQNFHGISALTGLPFVPPSCFQTKHCRNYRPNERASIIQGLCHNCHKWIDMQGPKETDLKVPEIFWWKHAQVCHRKSSTPLGVGGFFVENDWFNRVCSVLELLDGIEGEVKKLQAGNE